MKPGRNYVKTKTYSSVVKWNLIILLPAYVLAFIQFLVECDVYMRIPKDLDIVINNEGKSIVQGNKNDYVLQVQRNLYESKVAGRVWNGYLNKKLIQELGFCQSKIDDCLLQG